MAIDFALGAYRRHGDNNFISNPVIGANLPNAPETIDRHQQRIVRAMVQHLLDHHDRFATMFSVESVRNLLRMLFRKSLQYGASIQDSRLRNAIGTRRMLKDNLSYKLSPFRRLVSRLRALVAD